MHHQQRLQLRVAPAILATLLCACGGGGGATLPLNPIATASPSSGATTTASGIVRDDDSGTAIAGARVVLMPWGPCGATPPATALTPENDGCPTPLPSPQATTRADGSFTLNGAPNGHYVLVIGDDAVSTPPPNYSTPTPCGAVCPTPTPAPFTVRATVHDNVTLSGGNQLLRAPVMPAVPTIVPPAWETNGDYRLATLDATTEMPCYIAWQYQRAAHHLAASAVDEWLTENVRAVNAYAQIPNAQSAPLLTTGNAQIAGGSSCADLIDNYVFSNGGLDALRQQIVWFGARYSLYNGGTEAFGLSEFPLDPRLVSQQTGSYWL